ncbi:MAG: DNA-directed RNA polymerase subunit beta', partial [Christensenellales bacterium]
PMVQLDGGRFATNDLNDLYRRVINRNIRLKKLMELGAPDVIVRNEKRMLQEAVDALFDNGKRGKPVVGGSKNRELKSIAAALKGKSGRFRQNLLGKRVDYSGRAVIVIGPELKMYQCGVPKTMALELFKPFIMKKLVEMNQSYNIKSAKRMVEREQPIVWDILEEVIKEHPVLLNRAPTLHKLSIQAFEPVLVEGNAIKLHPLVCAGFNADFDGDQMAIHVPLSLEAQAEARFLMLASNNIVKPSDGSPIVTPQQDIVLGSYYLTMERPGAKGENSVYIDEDEAMMAYSLKDLALQAVIYVRKSYNLNGQIITGRVRTTIGRIIFNRVIPQDLGIVDRTNPDTCLNYEIDYNVGKKQLGEIVGLIYQKHGTTETAKCLDEIKALGYKYSTLSGITMNIFDMDIPAEREKIIAEADEKTAINEKLYMRGLLSLSDKQNKNIAIWEEATAKVGKAVQENLGTFNPMNIIAVSKARTNPSQLNQVCGMRGPISSTSGEKIDIPIKSNYRLGLSPFEYFMSARGGRKGLADVAMKTADAGYLTRRLVDVAQEVIITEDDCFASLGEKVKGVKVSSISIDSTEVISLKKRIIGRFATEDVINPATKEVIIAGNTMISPEQAEMVEKAGIKEVGIRTGLTCKCRSGICAKCYGKDMASNRLVALGEAVGIIAAQSVGEPGTQLTMKNFHTGGVSTAADITTGLPRVEELFEVRRPKGVAVLSEVSGKISINKVDKLDEVVVHSSDGDVSYVLPYGSDLLVKDGDQVEPGTQLTVGSIYPNDILRTQGMRKVQEYLMNQI